MSKILSVEAKTIFDSKGDSTIEVEVKTDDGKSGVASVPSGASPGSLEAKVVEPQLAVENIKTKIAPMFIGREIESQFDVDQALLKIDGTEDRSSLGANTILGISLAMARVAAECMGMPLYKYIGKIFDEGRSIALPLPIFNMVNGGVHANNNIDFQEFMVIPSGFSSSQEQLEVGKKIFMALKDVLTEKGLKTNTGDEGGYAPDLDTNEMAFGLMVEAVTKAGYKAGDNVDLALDVAAQYLPPTFQLNIQRYVDLIKTFPVVYLEDPLPEDAWHDWAQLKLEIEQANKSDKTVYLVGDDLFVTDAEKLKKGINNFVANAILIKINQAATLTEILEVINLAKQNNYIYVISHRAGETLDSFVADLAVGTGAKYVKAGAPNDYHKERMVKFERLVEIEKELKGL